MRYRDKGEEMIEKESKSDIYSASLHGECIGKYRVIANGALKLGYCHGRKNWVVIR